MSFKHGRYLGSAYEVTVRAVYRTFSPKEDMDDAEEDVTHQIEMFFENSPKTRGLQLVEVGVLNSVKQQDGWLIDVFCDTLTVVIANGEEADRIAADKAEFKVDTIGDISEDIKLVSLGVLQQDTVDMEVVVYTEDWG